MTEARFFRGAALAVTEIATQLTGYRVAAHVVDGVLRKTSNAMDSVHDEASGQLRDALNQIQELFKAGAPLGEPALYAMRPSSSRYRRPTTTLDPA